MAPTKNWFAILALLGLGIVACNTLPPENPESISFVADGSTKRIETLIHEWFARIEDPTADSSALDGFLSETPFELSLVDGTLRTRDELRAWVSNLHATYPKLGYQLGSIHIEPAGPDRYRALFEFDRQATDRAGLPHVARREHTWIVRESSNEAPALLEIEERPLIFFPGTGPKIVCY